MDFHSKNNFDCGGPDAFWGVIVIKNSSIFLSREIYMIFFLLAAVAAFWRGGAQYDLAVVVKRDVARRRCAAKIK